MNAVASPSWGQIHLSRLMVREWLNWGRQQQEQGFASMTMLEAKAGWEAAEMATFLADINAGWVPDIVSGFFEIIPGLNIDLRPGGIEHDIAYTVGGTMEQKLAADEALREWIIATHKGLPLLDELVADDIWAAVSIFGNFRHFIFKTDWLGSAGAQIAMERQDK